MDFQPVVDKYERHLFLILGAEAWSNFRKLLPRGKKSFEQVILQNDLQKFFIELIYGDCVLSLLQ